MIFFVSLISISDCFVVFSQMDLAGSMSPEECMEELSLNTIQDKAWHIE